MARIFDVVEYATEMEDEIVHRFPETGIADLAHQHDHYLYGKVRGA